MSAMKLVIGNRNYSSWSLRAWLVMRVAGVDFEEIVIPLDLPDTAAQIAEYSPAGRVPVLLDGGRAIWDSLAICEYIAELVPGAGLWPRDRAARGLARSVSAEMHSGFPALRSNLPMNIRADRPAPLLAGETRSDIDRITRIWRECREEFGKAGAFLFGAFSIADAMFAPVASRFRSYRIDLDPVARDYVEAVHALPDMQAWSAAARAETWIIEGEELYCG